MCKVDKYSLRFKSPKLEDAFNGSRHQMMCLNISRVATIGSLPILQQLGAMVMYLHSGVVVRIQTHIYFVSLCLLLALCLLWGTVPRLILLLLLLLLIIIIIIIMIITIIIMMILLLLLLLLLLLVIVIVIVIVIIIIYR